MSTTPSATASGRDCVPSDESNLTSRMCLFVITQKDGTLLNATSVTKEDIIKCVLKWATPILGCAPLLCNGISSSVLLNRGHATCYMWGHKATVLQSEAITVRAVAPSETHVKAYIVAVGGTLQMPISTLRGGRRTPLTP